MAVLLVRGLYLELRLMLLIIILAVSQKIKLLLAQGSDIFPVTVIMALGLLIILEHQYAIDEGW